MPYTKQVEFPWWEDVGFRAYAIAHYREAVKLAIAVRDAEKIPLGEAESYNIAMFAGILDKVASPLVYLKKDYDNLSLELKEKWNPSLKGATEKAAALAEQAKKALEG